MSSIEPGREAGPNSILRSPALTSRDVPAGVDSPLKNMSLWSGSNQMVIGTGLEQKGENLTPESRH